jgi:site-specific recombinase XerD
MTKKQNNLTMYRRHAASCEVSKPKILDKCECPLWVHGKLRGKFIRESLETRGQIAGLLKVQAMLDGKGGDDPTPGGGIALIGNVPNSERTLESAVEVLMSGKKKRASNTKKLYTNAFGHFRAYAEAHERVLLSQIDTDFMHQYFAEYDAGWKQATAQGRLTHLRVLFNFCKKKKWITDAPTADADLNYTKGKIGTGKVKRVPFKPHEVTAILAAIEQLPEEIRDRARALIYLMLYTGCRISDATFFEREYLTASNTANYYVIKTRKLISLAPEVQQAALDALKRLPESDVYFFQPDADDDYRAARTALRDGAEFSTLMPDYEARVRETTALVVKVLRLAKLDGACHRFRDTFAVNALTTGCDIFSLSQMLGHSDVRITQDHYLKLVDGYQVQMSQKTRGLAYIFPMTVAS